MRLNKTKKWLFTWQKLDLSIFARQLDRKNTFFLPVGDGAASTSEYRLVFTTYTLIHTVNMSRADPHGTGALGRCGEFEMMQTMSIAGQPRSTWDTRGMLCHFASAHSTPLRPAQAAGSNRGKICCRVTEVYRYIRKKCVRIWGYRLHLEESWLRLSCDSWEWQR